MNESNRTAVVGKFIELNLNNAPAKMENAAFRGRFIPAAAQNALQTFLQEKVQNALPVHITPLPPNEPGAKLELIAAAPEPGNPKLLELKFRLAGKGKNNGIFKEEFLRLFLGFPFAGGSVTLPGGSSIAFCRFDILKELVFEEKTEWGLAIDCGSFEAACLIDLASSVFNPGDAQITSEASRQAISPLDIERAATRFSAGRMELAIDREIFRHQLPPGLDEGFFVRLTNFNNRQSDLCLEAEFSIQGVWSDRGKILEAAAKINAALPLAVPADREGQIRIAAAYLPDPVKCETAGSSGNIRTRVEFKLVCAVV